jgi:hypothetical protein
MEADDLVERIAKAMYGTIAQNSEWELTKEDHRNLFRKEARAAITEFVAIANITAAFPEVERVE